MLPGGGPDRAFPEMGKTDRARFPQGIAARLRTGVQAGRGGGARGGREGGTHHKLYYRLLCDQ